MAQIGKIYQRNDKSKRQVVLVRELYGGREYEAQSTINRRKDRIRACDIYDRPAPSGWSLMSSGGSNGGGPKR